ncbi:MAG: AzlC family protein [Ilumatobacteraceae bacterium]|nr:AzlC family protein [Ilumatobacteraceae bacterium]
MSTEAVQTPARGGILPPIDRAGFRAGVRVMGTPSIAIAAWGLVTGVALVKGGLSVPIALVMTFGVFAGSAQLAVLPLLVTGAPLVVVWLTATFVNLRFVIFSAASRSYFGNLTWKQRLFAGYLNGDVGFALFMQRFSGATERGTPEQWGFFYGLAVVNWTSWMASSVVGIFLGGLAPTSWGLELAAVLALVAVLIPMVTRVPAILGVVVTGVGSVATAHVPLKLGLLASVVAGVTVAVVAETHLPKRAGAVEEAAEVAAHEGGYGS